MTLNLKRETSITAGKTYVPSKVGISPKNGLYEVRKYDSVIDPFAKQTTQSISDPADPFKQKTGYSPTHKTTDIANRKIEQYEGYTYDTYYDYAFPNDKDRVKKKQEPKPKQEPVHPKPKPKVKPKSKAVEPPETPLPYNASKCVSRTLIMMTKNNKVRPSRTNKKLTDDFD